jgi:hypothetical protein
LKKVDSFTRHGRPNPEEISRCEKDRREKGRRESHRDEEGQREERA